MIRSGQLAFRAFQHLQEPVFYSQNFDIWPIGAQVIILMAMYIGGMTGSTSSGIKIARHLILFQTIKLRMEQLFRPETIRQLKIGQKEIPRQNVINVFSFVAILIIVSALGTIFFVFDGIDLETSFGLVACAINNIGFAFRAVSPEGTFAILPPFSKVVMMLWMFLGRLELFAIAVLLLPSFWKNK